MNNITKPHTFVISTAADPTEVNANFDTAYTGVNNVIDALNTASGSKNSLDERLDVALNEDGTLKGPATNTVATSSPATITVNSSSAALTVTQTGAGHALVVEDSSADTSPFVVTADGSFRVGNSSTLAGYNVEFSKSDFGITRVVDSTSQANLYMAKSRGSGTSPTIVQSGDTLGTVWFRAHDGVDFVSTAAKIDAVIDGTPGADDTPGRLVFSTTPDGSNAAIERLRIDSAGHTKVTGTFETTGNATIGGNLTVTGTPTLGGSAAYQCRAWVQFNGTLDAANMIRASSPNVTSITDNNVGDYTINFGALVDTKYAVCGSAIRIDTTTTSVFQLHPTSPLATNRCRISVATGDDNRSLDPSIVSVAIFR